MRGAYLGSDAFYSFWSRPSSRQHPGNYILFQLKCTLVVFLFVCLFSHFAWELVWNHHHHVVPPARISLTLSRHFYLSFIASGRSSGLHPVSLHSCSMYVRAGRPAFAWPYAGVHRSTSLMSSSLLLEQCPACLVCLICIVFVMGGSWPYSWCLVGCCRQDLFNIARNRNLFWFIHSFQTIKNSLEWMSKSGEISVYNSSILSRNTTQIHKRTTWKKDKKKTQIELVEHYQAY